MGYVSFIITLAKLSLIECGHETAMFSGRAVYILGSLQLAGDYEVHDDGEVI